MKSYTASPNKSSGDHITLQVTLAHFSVYSAQLSYIENQVVICLLKGMLEGQSLTNNSLEKEKSQKGCKF